VPLPIQKSTAKSFVAADFEIGSKTVSLPIQKSAASNCTAADSEIDSQVLCRCLSRNWQPQTMSLLI
jgi:hypothetical protein